MLSTITLRKPEQAKEIAAVVLQSHAGQRIFAMHGELGAGKTTLIKAFCAALGVQDHTSSPSFAIVNEYRTPDGDPVYHFDLYRLRDRQELQDIGFEDYLDSGAYCFIEWPELAGDLLSADALHVRVEVDAKGLRTLRMA